MSISNKFISKDQPEHYKGGPLANNYTKRCWWNAAKTRGTTETYKIKSHNTTYLYTLSRALFFFISTFTFQLCQPLVHVNNAGKIPYHQRCRAMTLPLSANFIKYTIGKSENRLVANSKKVVGLVALMKRIKIVINAMSNWRNARISAEILPHKKNLSDSFFGVQTIILNLCIL